MFLSGLNVNNFADNARTHARTHAHMHTMKPMHTKKLSRNVFNNIKTTTEQKRDVHNVYLWL